MPIFIKLSLVFSFLLFPIVAFGANLQPPTLLHPTLDDSPIYAGEIKLEWTNTEAPFYRYHINIPGGLSDGDVVRGTFVKLYNLGMVEGFTYTWTAASCDNEEGKDCISQNNSESFQIVAAPKELVGGLVPCGRQYDNPETKYINEAKPCGFSDLFVLLKLVLDFVLWKLGLIILVLLTVLTGLVSYFSFGGPETIAKVKSIFKSAVTGYIIILLAWLVVNLLLRFLGYTFGQWWIISF